MNRSDTRIRSRVHTPVERVLYAGIVTGIVVVIGYLVYPVALRVAFFYALQNGFFCLTVFNGIAARFTSSTKAA